MNTKTDVCIIGAGSGGLSLAAAAVQLGLKVTLVEKALMGGDCLNYGCVPSKSLLAASKKAHSAVTSSKFGIEINAMRVNYQAVHDYIRNRIATIAPHDSIERFSSLGVNVIKGQAQFLDKKTIQVNEQNIQAKHFVIATGSSPYIPDILGLDNCFYLTNENIFELEQCPEHLVIIGGGPIGCEMAQAFSRLGAKVTMIIRTRLLPKEDPDIVKILREKFQHENITLLENSIIHSVMHDKDLIHATITHNENTIEIKGSRLLIAAGRKPNIDNLNLSAANVNYDEKGIKVNARLKTSNKKIYAIGDAAGPFQFTHTANYQASIVIRNMLFKLPSKVNYNTIAWVTYTDPEVAHIGLPHEQLNNIDTQEISANFSENDRAITEDETIGKIKIHLNKKGHVLSVDIIGHNAGELILPWAQIIKQKQKLSHIASSIVPYPAYSEINKLAAGKYYTPTLFSRRTRTIIKILNTLF